MIQGMALIIFHTLLHYKFIPVLFMLMKHHANKVCFPFLELLPYLNTHTLSLSLANNAHWNKARKKRPQFMLRLFSYGRTEACQFIQNKYNNVSSLSWLNIINGVLREILISLSINQNKWSCIVCTANIKFMCSLDRGYTWFSYCLTLLSLLRSRF